MFVSYGATQIFASFYPFFLAESFFCLALRALAKKRGGFQFKKNIFQVGVALYGCSLGPGGTATARESA